MPPSSSSYDDLPYESRILPFTHPIALATIATLYGLHPPAPETCRVLEIGCATGDNVMSMAASLPKASFVGIDYSSREIDDGLTRLHAVGLSNVELRCCSLMDIGVDFGEFDYMLCHGVYSWVSPDVADRILTLFARHLSPHGIAYVSYNIYPGWHMKSIIRDAMRFHVRSVSGLQEQVKAARMFLHGLLNSATKNDEIYRMLLKVSAEEMDTYRDDYLYHEFLEEWNCPVSFTEFMERVTRKGLQYVGSAKFTQWEATLSSEVKQTLASIPDRTTREQYLDFLGNRTFRKSLLCRGGSSVYDALSIEALQRCLVTTDVRPVTEEADLASCEAVEFRSSTQDQVTTNKPHVKLALGYVGKHAPRPVPFASIWPAIEPLLPAQGDPDAGPSSLAEALLQCFQGNLVDIAVSDFPFVLDVSPQPVASPLARVQAMQKDMAVNLRHRLVRLSDLERMVLAHLDGAHDRAALCQVLSESIDRGDLDLLDQEGAPVLDRAVRDSLIDAALDPCLHQLATHAFLLG